jgi:CBS domain containing-hemolysin-like protein
MPEFLLLFGVGVLVALNGLFVAAEFALVRASQGRLEQLRDEGRRGAALVLKQVEHIDEYLSACQLGITMASLGIGFLGEPAIASLFEDAFGTTISHGASLAISLGLAY